MALNFFRVKVISGKTMSFKISDIINNSPDEVRKALKAEINGASTIDLFYKDIDSAQEVYQVYCSKCGKKEAAVKFGGGFKCIVCWTVRPGHYRTNLRRRKKWSK